jgi:hypothetical protein
MLGLQARGICREAHAMRSSPARRLLLAAFLAVIAAFEARANPVFENVQLTLPSADMPGAMCYATRQAGALTLRGLKYQPLGLPENYSDCQSDYVVSLTIIDTEIRQESSFLSCMQMESQKHKDDSEIVERLSRDIADAATALRELRQRRPERVTEAEGVRKQCQEAVDRLSAYRKPAPDRPKIALPPVNLEKFAEVVSGQLEADGVLDPQNPFHAQLMSKLASIGLTYGKNSKEYAAALAELNKVRNDVIAASTGAPCTEGSPAQALASRLWQKGRKLAAGGKTGAALVAMKQSLEFCPDAERAAQLAELSKAPKPAVQGFDGTYAGTMRIQAKPSTGTADGSLVLTVERGRLSGSFSWRQAGVSATVSGRTIEAAISGQVSEDGGITATLTGKSSAEVAPGAGIAGGVMTALLTFSFQGRFTGSIADNAATGSVTAQKPAFAKDKPPETMTGTWTVTRRQ